MSNIFNILLFSTIFTPVYILMTIVPDTAFSRLYLA